MTDRHYETRFGIEVYRLLITQYPREAWLTVRAAATFPVTDKETADAQY